MAMRFSLIILIGLVLSQTAFAQEPATEVQVQLIPLAPPLDQAVAEYSGMTWCGDRLILIPQYPKRLAKRFTSSGNSYFYALAKQDILNYIDGKTTKPLHGEAIEVLENTVRARALVFDGFEGAACDGDKLWLTIESVSLLRNYRSYMVPATLGTKNGKSKITIEADRIVKLGSQSKLVNKGDEALTVWNDSVMAFHEVNSVQHVQNPVAQVVNTKSGEKSQLSFPNIPFRLTDATSVDSSGRFWGLNYRFNGDNFSDKSQDNILKAFTPGATHGKSDNVERLLEFQITANEIKLVDRAPIQLLLESPVGRNWEALARLDDRGFLIATDKHPTSLFGFIPFP